MGFAFQPKIGLATVACTQTVYETLMNDAAHNRAVEKIHEIFKEEAASRQAGRAEEAKQLKTKGDTMKRQLPGFCFSADRFEPHEWIDSNGKNHGTDAWRQQEHAIVSGLAMVDLDHLEDPLQTWTMIMAHEAYKQWKDRMMMAFITPSGYGLKIVVTCRLEDGNLASHQIRFCKDFGLENDKSTKDASRLSFCCGKADVLLLNNEIFSYYDEDYSKKYTPKYKQGVSEPDLFAEEEMGQPEKAAASDAPAAEEPSDQEIEAYNYHGLTIDAIVNAWLGGKAPKIGDRHDSLLNLAHELCYVCERKDRIIRHWLHKLPWVQDLASEGDPVEKTIGDGIAYKKSPHMPKKMAAVVKQLTRDKEKGTEGEVTEKEMTEKYRQFGEQIEKMFHLYPILKDICHGLDTPSYPAALFVGGALYGTLTTRTWYYFYHLPEMMRRLNYSVFIIADPANGKSFVSWLYKLILSPVIASDKVGNDAINKYKKEVNARETSTKEQKKEPLVEPTPIIRIHGARTANGVFIEDMNNAVEIIDGMPLHLHMFTFDSELDSATAAAKGGQWIDKTNMELKAFHNEEDNQQYKNNRSVSGPFDVFWNFVYTGTPLSLSKKVNARNFGSGLFSRLAVIPLCGDSFKMMPLSRRSKVNQAVMERLKTWAFNLDKVQGELPLWPLVEYCWNWTNELMEIAREENDKMIAMLIKRVAYYGINVSAPFILMRHWDEWKAGKTFRIDSYDKALCGLILEIQYYSQKVFFGKQVEVYFDNQRQEMNDNVVRRKGRNTDVLYNMPEEFNKEGLIQFMKCKESYARVILHRWVKEGKVKKTGVGNNARYIRI